MEALLRLPDPPDAVFAASDSMAIGALKAVRAAGLRVPDDVALVGFDDIPLASALEPPLTTIRQPIFRLGHTAACVLVDDLLRAPEGERGIGAGPAHRPRRGAGRSANPAVSASVSNQTSGHPDQLLSA